MAADVENVFQPSVLFTFGADCLIESVSRTPGRGSDTIRPQMTYEGGRLGSLAGLQTLLSDWSQTGVLFHLQDARQKFRSVLLEATVKLEELLKKISKAVDESKPYWEARRLARQVSQSVNEAVGHSVNLRTRQVSQPVKSHPTSQSATVVEKYS